MGTQCHYGNHTEPDCAEKESEDNLTVCFACDEANSEMCEEPWCEIEDAGEGKCGDKKKYSEFACYNHESLIPSNVKAAIEDDDWPWVEKCEAKDDWSGC